MEGFSDPRGYFIAAITGYEHNLCPPLRQQPPAPNPDCGDLQRFAAGLSDGVRLNVGNPSQPQLAAHGAHRGFGEPGLKASTASCRDANGSKIK